MPKMNRFAVGDRVFAKVKGYPHWPARVEKYNPDPSGKLLKKYPVRFYGTYETQLLFVVPESQEWDKMFTKSVKEFDDACIRAGISEETKISLVQDPTHHKK